MTMTFTSTVAGIPCLIEIDRFFAQPALGPSCDSDLDCYGYTEVDFTVCDRRGRPAPWLERKLTDKDRERISNEATESVYAYDNY